MVAASLHRHPDGHVDDRGPHQQFLHHPGVIVEIDWSRAVVNSVAVRAEKGDLNRGPNPVDRASQERSARLPVAVTRLAFSPGSNRIMALTDGVVYETGAGGLIRRVGTVDGSVVSWAGTETGF